MRNQAKLDRTAVGASVALLAIVGFFALAALLLALSALVRPVNHDEGQYVSAIGLMRVGLPYIDFAYLQTPLQPLLLSPLAMIPAGWLLVAVRVANGLFAVSSLTMLMIALRPRARLANILIALSALACTDAFLLAGSVARNDALPMMLQSGAILALFRAIDDKHSPQLFGIAGLLLGLATSAKISAAVPAAGAGLFVLLRARDNGSGNVLAFCGGMVAGLLPCFAFAGAAPAEFRFDVFDYSLNAPRQWWSSVGKATSLEPAYRVGRLFALSSHGATLVALVATLLDRHWRDHRLLLDLMIFCGLIGSYLPEPAFAQYLVPLLPALFARFALALDAVGRWRPPLLALTAAGCIAGLEDTAKQLAHTLSRGPDLVAAVGQGRAVARLAAGGPVVTLSPERVTGSDVNLDPRFASGPFLFRSLGALSVSALRLGHSPNWQRTAGALDTAPPALVLVGGENRPHPPIHPDGLDHSLRAWAEARGYQPVKLSGGFVAWRRPPPLICPRPRRIRHRPTNRRGSKDSQLR